MRGDSLIKTMWLAVQCNLFKHVRYLSSNEHKRTCSLVSLTGTSIPAADRVILLFGPMCQFSWQKNTRQLRWYLHRPPSGCSSSLTCHSRFVVLLKMWHSVLLYMKLLNKCVVACSEERGWDQFGRKGNKDFWRAVLLHHRLTCARWLQGRWRPDDSQFTTVSGAPWLPNLQLWTGPSLPFCAWKTNRKECIGTYSVQKEHFLFGYAVYCKWGGKTYGGQYKNMQA